MEAFSEGRTEVRLREYPRNNEIKVLYETFNHMAEQIMKLKIDVYENMLDKQRIQSSYLRVQIQPHLYTNILNLIYGLAEIRDYKGIQELAVYMSRYFRYLLSTKKDFVRLEQEIGCVEDYIKIQQVRYPECLDFSLECDAERKEEWVPPLLLQTFIENGIKHNITLVPRLTLHIVVRKYPGSLVFLISDTGVGFRQEMLRKLEAGGRYRRKWAAYRYCEYQEQAEAFISWKGRNQNKEPGTGGGDIYTDSGKKGGIAG